MWEQSFSSLAPLSELESLELVFLRLRHAWKSVHSVCDCVVWSVCVFGVRVVCYMSVLGARSCVFFWVGSGDRKTEGNQEPHACIFAHFCMPFA